MFDETRVELMPRFNKQRGFASVEGGEEDVDYKRGINVNDIICFIGISY